MVHKTRLLTHTHIHTRAHIHTPDYHVHWQCLLFGMHWKSSHWTFSVERWQNCKSPFVYNCTFMYDNPIVYPWNNTWNCLICSWSLCHNCSPYNAIFLSYFVVVMFSYNKYHRLHFREITKTCTYNLWYLFYSLPHTHTHARTNSHTQWY